MKRLSKIAATVLATGSLLFVAGCMSPAQKLEKEPVLTSLHTGQTQAEVRQLLGRAARSDAASNGKSLDLFIVTLPAIASPVPATEVRSVYVLYDATGKLERFTWYSGTARNHAIHFNGQWRSGRSFSTEDLSHIKPTATTRGELISLFGDPTLEDLDAYGYKTMSWLFLHGGRTVGYAGQELIVRLNEKSTVTDYMLRNLQP